MEDNTYGKYLVYAQRGSDNLLLSHLERDDENQRTVWTCYAFSNTPSISAPDRGALYAVAHSNIPYSEGEFTLAQLWNFNKEGWEDNTNINGFIDVYEAVQSIEAATGRNYTVN